MDPITQAIIAALLKLAEPAIKDGYDVLKSLLTRKLGSDSQVINAVNQLEKKKTDSWRGVLEEEITAAKANDDPELRKAAEALLTKFKELPGGQQIVQQIVEGDENIFSVWGNVSVNKGK